VSRFQSYFVRTKLYVKVIFRVEVPIWRAQLAFQLFLLSWNIASLRPTEMGLGSGFLSSTGFTGCAGLSGCMGFSSGVAGSDLFTHLSKTSLSLLCELAAL
jgi:hypothetical protein